MHPTFCFPQEESVLSSLKSYPVLPFLTSLCDCLFDMFSKRYFFIVITCSAWKHESLRVWTLKGKTVNKPVIVLHIFPCILPEARFSSFLLSSLRRNRPGSKIRPCYQLLLSLWRTFDREFKHNAQTVFSFHPQRKQAARSLFVLQMSTSFLL